MNRLKFQDQESENSNGGPNFNYEHKIEGIPYILTDTHYNQQLKLGDLMMIKNEVKKMKPQPATKKLNKPKLKSKRIPEFPKRVKRNRSKGGRKNSSISAKRNLSIPKWNTDNKVEAYFDQTLNKQPKRSENAPQKINQNDASTAGKFYENPKYFTDVEEFKIHYDAGKKI